MFPSASSYGMQMLFDRQQNLSSNAVPVFYVVEGFQASEIASISEIGLSYSGDDVANAQPGTLPDIQITPTPNVSALTLSQIAGITQTDTQLRLGSIMFTVSSTWVDQMVAQFGYASEKDVFVHDTVQGLRFRGTLYEIADATPNNGLNSNLSWNVYCNAPLSQGEQSQ